MKFLYFHRSEDPEANLTRRAAARAYLESKAAQRRARRLQLVITCILLAVLAFVLWLNFF